MNHSPSLRFNFLASSVVVLTVVLTGCSNDSTTAAQFTASPTARNPGLVTLEQRSLSGARMVVDVRLHGPEPALDLFAFQFGIRNGDPNLVKFIPQSSYAQGALVADDGQTIAIDVDAADPSLIQVNVEKQGGGAGNGFAGDSVVVIQLTFDVQGSGVTTLALTGLGDDPPQAIDSTRASIGAVNFDAANASVKGVTTGGSGY